MYTKAVKRHNLYRPGGLKAKIQISIYRVQAHIWDEKEQARASVAFPCPFTRGKINTTSLSASAFTRHPPPP